MAEELLHGTEVGTAVEQVGRRGVAKSVGACGPCPGQLGQEGGNQCVHRAAPQSLPPRAHKHRVVGGAVGTGPSLTVASIHSRQQSGATIVEIRAQGPPGRHAKWHNALFGALSGDAQRAALVIDVATVEADQLAHAQRTRVQQLDDGHVTQCGGISSARVIGEPSKQLVNLRPRQHARQ